MNNTQEKPEDFENPTQNLVRLCAIFELLTCSLSKNTSVDFGGFSGSTPVGIKFMYNYARICQILRRFETSASIESIDYSGVSEHVKLTTWTEFRPIFHHLEAVKVKQLLNLDQASISDMLKLAENLCRSFSRFYRNSQVLVESLDHLKQGILCKIQLLTCLKEYFERFFECLDVSPIAYM